MVGWHFPFSNSYTFILRMCAISLSYISPLTLKMLISLLDWDSSTSLFIWLLLYHNVQILPYPGHSSKWPSSLFIMAPTIDYKTVYYHILCYRSVTLLSQLLQLVIMRKLMSLVFPICQHDIEEGKWLLELVWSALVFQLWCLSSWDPAHISLPFIILVSSAVKWKY